MRRCAQEAVDGREVWDAQIDYLVMGAKDTCGLRTFLVPPDGGVVAWVAEENFAPDMNAAKVVLEQSVRF